MRWFKSIENAIEVFMDSGVFMSPAIQLEFVFACMYACTHNLFCMQSCERACVRTCPLGSIYSTKSPKSAANVIEVSIGRFHTSSLLESTHCLCGDCLEHRVNSLMPRFLQSRVSIYWVSCLRHLSQLMAGFWRNFKVH